MGPSPELKLEQVWVGTGQGTDRCRLSRKSKRDGREGMGFARMVRCKRAEGVRYLLRLWEETSRGGGLVCELRNRMFGCLGGVVVGVVLTMLAMVATLELGCEQARGGQKHWKE